LDSTYTVVIRAIISFAATLYLQINHLYQSNNVRKVPVTLSGSPKHQRTVHDYPWFQVYSFRRICYLQRLSTNAADYENSPRCFKNLRGWHGLSTTSITIEEEPTMSQQRDATRFATPGQS
jgi:hypothetical protein